MDSMMMPLFLVGSIIAAIIVGLQYFLIFRSHGRVLGFTVLAGTAAFYLTRWALNSFASEMRDSLGRAAGDAGLFYVEIT